MIFIALYILIPDFFLLAKYLCNAFVEHLSVDRLLIVTSLVKIMGLGLITTGGLVAVRTTPSNGVQFMLAIIASIPIKYKNLCKNYTYVAM